MRKPSSGRPPPPSGAPERIVPATQRSRARTPRDPERRVVHYRWLVALPLADRFARPHHRRCSRCRGDARRTVRGPGRRHSDDALFGGDELDDPVLADRERADPRAGEADSTPSAAPSVTQTGSCSNSLVAPSSSMPKKSCSPVESPARTSSQLAVRLAVMTSVAPAVGGAELCCLGGRWPLVRAMPTARTEPIAWPLRFAPPARIGSCRWELQQRRKRPPSSWPPSRRLPP